MCTPSRPSRACPRRSSCDNQKQVVLARTADGPRFHPEFLSFCGQFGFSPRLCRPYRARTKGKVERSIGYVKDRFFCGRTFTGLCDMNDQLSRWLSEVEERSLSVYEEVAV